MLNIIYSVLPAGSVYMLYSIRDTVCHRRFFYSAVNMPMTQVALAHSLVLGTMVSREPAGLDVVLPALCWIMISWHAFLAKPAGSSKLIFPVQTHIPNNEARARVDYYVRIA